MSVIMNYYRHIDRTKIQFDFLCFIPCQESYEEEISGLGGNVYFISKPSNLRALRELGLFFREHYGEYSWLHNHEVYLSVFLRAVSLKNGIKNYIIHCHATQYSDRTTAALRNCFLCIPIPLLNCYRFACSNAAGYFLFQRSQIRKRPFFILPNAIERKLFLYDSDVRKSYRKQLGLEDTFLLGHIGRFVPQKNHMFLLDIFQEICTRIPRAHLLLIGGGPLLDKVQQASQQMKIRERVHFLGHREDIAQLLQAMDLFLLPSLYEGLPLSCLEAQAAGLPCLVSDAVSREVVFSRNVHMLPVSSKSSWVQACLLEAEKYAAKATKTRSCPKLLPDIAVEAKKLEHFYEMREPELENIY